MEASSMVLGAYQRAMQSARSKKGLDGGAVSAFSSACAQYAQAAQKLAGAYFFVQDLCTDSQVQHWSNSVKCSSLVWLPKNGQNGHFTESRT